MVRILNSQIFITGCCVLCFRCDISLLFKKQHNLTKVDVDIGIFSTAKLSKLVETQHMCIFWKCTKLCGNAQVPMLAVFDIYVLATFEAEVLAILCKARETG